MNMIFIRYQDLDDFVIEHLPSNKDLCSLDELIGIIEELDYEIKQMKEEKEKKEYENDYPQEEYDREQYYEWKYGDKNE